MEVFRVYNRGIYAANTSLGTIIRKDAALVSVKYMKATLQNTGGVKDAGM